MLEKRKALFAVGGGLFNNLGEMNMKLTKSLLGISVASALLAMSGNASASAFALIEQSSGLGNAFAGGAAAAEDATTIFTNPAGMSRLKGNQVSVAGSFIKPSAKFSNTASQAGTAQPLGDNGGDAGSLSLLPNAYMVMEIEPALRFGLGINAPFGLQTEYDSTWAGRYQAIKSKLQTVNLNPSLAYQMNDNVSLGIGVNYQHITGDLTSATNYAGGVYGAVLPFGTAAAAAAAGAATAAGQGEGLSTLTGSDSQWGYNFGVLFNLDPNTRIGMAYRSKIKYTLSGSVAFSSNRPTAATLTPVVGAGAAGLIAAGIAAKTADGAINLPIEMPATFSISGLHNLNDKWDIMADATWTGWGTFQQLKVDYTTGANLQTTPENWKNTWRFSLGGTYHYNEQWLSRVGVAYDQSPVPDAYRTARIPDNNRTWLAFGGQYKVSAASKFDFGYAHLFVKDTTIANNQSSTGAGNLVGTYSNSVDILSVQYAYNF